MQAAETRAYVDRALLIAARAALLLVLAMPLVVTRDTFFPFVVGKALYSRVLIEIAFAVWIVLAVRNPSYRPVLSRLMIALAVYVVVSLIASFAGVSLQRSIWSTYERMQGVVDLAHWLAFALALTSVFRTRQDWRHVLNLSLLTGVVMALMGAAVMVGWELPVYDFLEAGQRITLTLGNPTYVGAYMLINALIGTGLLLDSFTVRTPEGRGSAAAGRRRRRRTERPGAGTASTVLWWRLFWAAAVALSLWMMLESSTRGALVGLVGALVAVSVGYVLWGRLRNVKVAAVAMIVAIAAFGLFLVLGAETAAAQRLAERSYVVERFIQTGQGNDTSLKGRLASVSFGLQGFIERPVLGWGPENYVVAWGRHYDAKEIGDYRGPPFDQAHNKPIEELTTRGAVGLASYLSLWVLMLWTVCTRVRRLGADREVLTLVVGAAMVGYFAQNLFLFDTPTTVLQFMVLLGFAVSLDTTYDGSAEDQRQRRMGRAERGCSSRPAPSPRASPPGLQGARSRMGRCRSPGRTGGNDGLHGEREGLPGRPGGEQGRGPAGAHVAAEARPLRPVDGPVPAACQLHATVHVHELRQRVGCSVQDRSGGEGDGHGRPGGGGGRGERAGVVGGLRQSRCRIPERGVAGSLVCGNRAHLHKDRREAGA